ncbi:MAG: hypothetical protein JWN40_5321 [Phycisphaerales bacterium]|nr:hypothetical protein [Phycisphaerales bacterium]
MSKRGKPDRRVSRDPKGSATSTTDPETTCHPLKRRPRLFAVLLVSFIIWLGVLLTLYFRTVYPMRYPSTDATATRPGASALPSAPR